MVVVYSHTVLCNYLMLFLFGYRRRRKAKGGKGKGKSGGRGNPKNKEDPSSSKGQKKASTLAEASNLPAKSALCKDSHSDEGKNTLKKLVNGHEADPKSDDGAGGMLKSNNSQGCYHKMLCST